MKKKFAAFLMGALVFVSFPVEAQTRGELEDRVNTLEIKVGKLELDNETKGRTIRRLCRKVGLERCPIDGFAE